MKRLLFALLVVSVTAPATADAQSRSKSKSSTTKRAPARVIHVSRSDDCCWGNRWYLEPYAGITEDPYDASVDDDDNAFLVGFRVGYHLSSRGRLNGNVAYSNSNDVSNPNGLPDYFVYDNNWIFTTVGGEFDVVPGQTSATLGLQVGAAWRQVNVDGTVGTPIGTPIDDDSFNAQEVLIPSLNLRHRLTNRTTIMAGLQDNIFDFFEGPAKHSLAVTAGISFR